MCFDSDDNSKKIAKVELQSGKIAHMDYSTIRKHFSDKLIEYYERCLENKWRTDHTYIYKWDI